MIRKFALLATVAAIMVGCGGADVENMEAKMKAAADSIKAATEKAAAEAEAKMKAEADSIANAAKVGVDSVAATATEAVSGH